MFSPILCDRSQAEWRGPHQNESLVLPPGLQPIPSPSRQQVGFPRLILKTRLVFPNGMTTEQPALFIDIAGIGDERCGFSFVGRDAPSRVVCL